MAICLLVKDRESVVSNWNGKPRPDKPMLNLAMELDAERYGCTFYEIAYLFPIFTLGIHFTLRNGMDGDRIGFDGGRAGRLMPKIVIHRVRLWWDDFWESDNFFITVILRPIFLWPVLVIGFALWPITASIILLRWLYKNIPRFLRVKVQGVSRGWLLLPIALFILSYLLFYYVFRYW